MAKGIEVVEAPKQRKARRPVPFFVQVRDEQVRDEETWKDVPGKAAVANTADGMKRIEELGLTAEYRVIAVTWRGKATAKQTTTVLFE